MAEVIVIVAHLRTNLERETDTGEQSNLHLKDKLARRASLWTYGLFHAWIRVEGTYRRKRQKVWTQSGVGSAVGTYLYDRNLNSSRNSPGLIDGGYGQREMSYI